MRPSSAMLKVSNYKLPAVKDVFEEETFSMAEKDIREVIL